MKQPISHTNISTLQQYDEFTKYSELLFKEIHKNVNLNKKCHDGDITSVLAQFYDPLIHQETNKY